MVDLTKEEFEEFAKKEFPGKNYKWEYDGKTGYFYIQAGTGKYSADDLHYEFIDGRVHLHIEGDNWRLFRDYLKQNISTSEVCSSYWDRNDCQWTLQCSDIQNSEDVKEAFLRIRQIMEPNILRREKELSLFHINLEQDLQGEVTDEYNKLLNLFKETFNRIKQEQRMLPYHINVIDELHINENAHSRILLKLLQYVSDNGTYDIYKSLLDYIREKKHNQLFGSIEIRKPHFTQEEQRIDLWVRDKDYAIIFENKACYANDQPEQISNYIKKTLKTDYQGYKKSSIFVVYLSPNGEEPEDQSWGTYKNEFIGRYINLSFKNDILPWLKDYVKPNIRLKDVYLQSAVEQYIDHLEGSFYLQTLQKQLNMNLSNFFYKNFNLDRYQGNYQAQVQTIQEQIDDMQSVLNKISEYQDSVREQIFEQWRSKTKELFPELQPCKMAAVSKAYCDVTIEFDSKPINIFIFEDSKLYCQVQFDQSSDQKMIQGTVIEIFNDLLPDHNDHCVWKYFQRHNYSDVFTLFQQVVERFVEIKQNQEMISTES